MTQAHSKLRLTPRGRKVVGILILIGITMFAAFWIEMQMVQNKASQERLNQIVEQQHVEQQIQEDDGPQDGSTDCWTVRMCELIEQGYKPLGFDLDGHKDCLVLVGDTSLVECPDGFKTTS